MNKIVSQLKDYLAQTDKAIFICSTIFIGIFIFLNYHFGIEKKIKGLTDLQQFFCWLAIFTVSFSLPYVLHYLKGKKEVFQNRKFVLLLLAGPAIFAWKISADIHFDFTDNKEENTYWNLVAYWPFKLLVVIAALFLLWKMLDKQQPFYGMSRKNLQVKPYFIMLLIMVPLVALAATQPDFLAMYPKFQTIGTSANTGRLLLYELSYGTDFFSIELFFRGFLILAFEKWVGKDAILPMALFYCTIHFGKPLAECVSSFFGGLILGVITHHTRTIYGGLAVHLGIAWLMELGGYLGNLI